MNDTKKVATRNGKIFSSENTRTEHEEKNLMNPVIARSCLEMAANFTSAMTLSAHLANAQFWELSHWLAPFIIIGYELIVRQKGILLVKFEVVFVMHIRNEQWHAFILSVQFSS